MLPIPFARLVRDMRALQDEFFKTSPHLRPPDLVGRARDLEKKVDKAIKQILGPPGLFDRKEDE